MAYGSGIEAGWGIMEVQFRVNDWINGRGLQEGKTFAPGRQDPVKFTARYVWIV
jgi:hypothetical protein